MKQKFSDVGRRKIMTSGFKMWNARNVIMKIALIWQIIIIIFVSDVCKSNS
jgi:hypothetical protein